MVLFLSGLVLTPLNKMVMQNENIVTFLMLSAPFSFLPLFLSAFGVRSHSLLCTPLIVFLHQLHTINHHLSFFMIKLLTIPLFGFLVVLALSLFLLINEQSSNLVLVLHLSDISLLWLPFAVGLFIKWMWRMLSLMETSKKKCTCNHSLVILTQATKFVAFVMLFMASSRLLKLGLKNFA